MKWLSEKGKLKYLCVSTLERQKVCFNDKTLYKGLRPVSDILSPLREKFQF